MSQTAIAPRYLQKAIDRLKAIGLGGQEPSAKPIAALIQRISEGDEDRALVVARTLAQQEVFDSVVADQISQMNVGTRFQAITDGFDSIREDARRLVGQAEKDSPSIGDRVSNIVMKITRGDIADRFDSIKETYGKVIGDVQEQIERERAILEAYMDYRSAIKEAEVVAHEIKDRLAGEWETAKAALAEASAAVEAAGDAAGPERARLELARDEKARAAKAAEARWQVSKDLAENLTVAYSVTEVTMARMAQSHDAKDRMWQQAVSFFATNSGVLSALKATYTGLVGLNEITKVQQAMQEGISKSLESLADVGHKVTSEAVRTAHGPTIRADAVRKLVDSVVEFQSESTKAIAEMRTLATQNAKEIRDAVEDGKRRVAALAAARVQA